MGHLAGKRILLCITGSIAAYKSAVLTRLLVKEGAEVKIIMTEAAKAFISPLTLSTLSRNKVLDQLFEEGQWSNHVQLGLWADAMVIAPVTAHTLSKCASGLADNLLVATYLSARCPVFFAPAMDLDMWDHGSTRKNIESLQSFGNQIIPVESGELASGLTGEGRMAEPENIIQYLSVFFQQGGRLRGKKAIVTAGPTYEPIDPVRFMGNPSTGKMGIAIAESLTSHGAEVELILGPTHISPTSRNMKVTRVRTAEEMYFAAMESFPGSDIAVLAAAVADYRPAHYSEQKVKKTEGDLTIALERTRDIAAEIAAAKGDHHVVVGFALETNNEEEHARAKLEKKKFDFIVLNSLRDEGAGFSHDTNKVSFLFEGNRKEEFQLKSKVEVASDISNAIIDLINAKSNAQ